MAITTTVFAGAVLGTLYNKWVAGKPYGEIAKRLGILVASGMIVGESLFGVFTAGVVAASGNGNVLALVPADSGWPAMLAAVVGLAAATYGLYAWTKSKADKV